jgi:hypothetical protein
MSYLKLTLLSTSLGDIDCENEAHMVIDVADDDNNRVQLRFLWVEGQDSIRCVGDASTMNHIYSGMHLIGLVTTFLFDKLNSDHEFLSDVFASDEGVDKLLMPVEEPIYGSGG